jgi:transposase
MGRRNKYSEEFKKDAVRLFLSRGERTAEEVAESLGIASNMLYRWKKKYELSITGVVASQDNNEETENLRRRLRQLEMENALLKKAAAFFAKEIL